MKRSAGTWRAAALAATLGLLTTAAAGAADPPASNGFAQDLTHFDSVVSGIAKGKDGTGKQLLGPARDVAVTWQRLSGELPAHGFVAEEAIANRAVAAFESTWKTAKDPRPYASDIMDALSGVPATAPLSKPPVSGS